MAQAFAGSYIAAAEPTAETAKIPDAFASLWLSQGCERVRGFERTENLAASSESIP